MTKRRSYATEVERITANVVVNEAGCWIWQQHITVKGYGRVTGGDRLARAAHRYSYELLVGPIPPGMTLDHTCRVRHCVNPAHLEPVTQRENSLRSPLTINSINAAKTHCPQGHPYDEANTYIVPSTRGRMCWACMREKERRRRLQTHLNRARRARLLTP